MCLATAAAIASIAGVASSIGGTIMGGIAQANAANFQAAVAGNQAQVMENNAIADEQMADYAGNVGLQNAQVESMKGAARMAKIKAGFAASGIDPNTGSAVDVREGQGEINKLNAENVLSDAELKAYGYRSRASEDRYAAKMLRAGAGFSESTGSDARTGSYLKAGGTLLSSLSSLPFKFGDSSDVRPTTPTAPYTVDTLRNSGLPGAYEFA